MPEGWRPINENHAIDVMAVVISFVEPIPTVLFKKALDAAEGASFGAGLRSRHSVQSLQQQWILGSGGLAIQPMNERGLQGRFFNSLFEETEGAPPTSRVAEQLHVDQNQLLYRTWRYVSWQWQVERMRTLMIPPLIQVQEIIPVATLRLEYLDRFHFSGDRSSIGVETVLRKDSPMIAPHAFSRSDLWHCHTGAYLPDINGTKRLELIQVDLLDDPPNARWLNVMTAREN